MTLAYAVELAKGTGIEIIVFNVINQRDINMVATVSHYAPDEIHVESYIRDLKKRQTRKDKEHYKREFF